jgi:hypothetical protein
MDTQRFDALTVTLARSGSRRSLLRGLAGGVLGVVAVDQTARTAAAKARPVAEGCGHAGRTCDATVTCCANLTCSQSDGVSTFCNQGAGFEGTKCCAPVGTACHGHCECCKTYDRNGNLIDTKCRDGRCVKVTQ